jgi:phage-related tail protein
MSDIEEENDIIELCRIVDEYKIALDEKQESILRLESQEEKLNIENKYLRKVINEQSNKVTTLEATISELLIDFDNLTEDYDRKVVELKSLQVLFYLL